MSDPIVPPAPDSSTPATATPSAAPAPARRRAHRYATHPAVGLLPCVLRYQAGKKIAVDDNDGLCRACGFDVPWHELTEDDFAGDPSSEVRVTAQLREAAARAARD